MQNNIIKNNGEQFFQENNYYAINYSVEHTHRCIEQPRKAMRLSTAIWITIVGVIADIVTICSGIAELNIIGIKDMFFTYKLHIYVAIIAIVFIFIIWMLKIIFSLLINKTYGAFLLKNNYIYIVRLKKCPICGESCGGKLKLEKTNQGVFGVCHRDKTHRWKLEYDIIMKAI